MKPHLRRRQSPYPARVPEILEYWSQKTFWATLLVFIVVSAVGFVFLSPLFFIFALMTLVFGFMGIRDLLQVKHTVRRNFPVLGRLRYVLEGLRPEIRQYFVESDREENPISRELRSIVYSRAKNQLDTIPFGTQRNVYQGGYEWIHHSLAAIKAPDKEKRIRIGEASGVAQPYDASLLNVSAMSFGSLSKPAIRALNEGAKRGKFAHNTGEGGVSPYHLDPGGDLIWQVGTGYFGCRDKEGNFDSEKFKQTASHPNIKMIELKLSQGAKPGHGGILPAKKVTAEIANIRGVPEGEDVLSPPYHTAFNSPIQLMRFIDQMRQLSGGKPVGFKLCLGSRREFLSLVKAMQETRIVPDFIAVDGAEGGTGAAPAEFSNSVGTPLIDGLVYIHQALIAGGVRDQTKLIASGKVFTGFQIVRLLALGADVTSSARAMMFSLGCIQALKCNTNHCPVGVATQDERLARGLDVENKATRVYNFHRKTVHAAYELLGAAGLDDPATLMPRHLNRRCEDGVIRNYAQLYPAPDYDALRQGTADKQMEYLWKRCHPDKFQAID